MDIFKDFPGISSKEWRKKMETDLKGKNPDELLTWNSFEGIQVFPFYNRDSPTHSSLNQITKKNNGWKINQRIVIKDKIKANKKALSALRGGANSLTFFGEINGSEEAITLLKDIQVELIDIQFITPYPKKTADILSSVIQKEEIGNCSVGFDYLGNLLIAGNWIDNEEKDLEHLHAFINASSPLACIPINGRAYSNAGASLVQELAFSMAQGVEYYSILTDRNVTPSAIADNMVFHFGVGSNYFFEIAKFRAARILWKKIVNEYVTEAPPEMVIHATNSTWNLTSYDAHVNILRTTSAAMSAIIGGIDAITVTPYNSVFEDSNAFSERIARNTALILQEEAFLDKVKNPADGSFYIEYLTDKMAEKAWKLFQKVEENDGFLACLKNGFVQQEIEAVSKKKKEAIDKGDMVLVGTNKFQNTSEENSFSLAQKSSNTSEKESSFTPLDMSRGAENIETMRYQKEETPS